MNVDEQIWFVIGLGGFLIFFETALTKILHFAWAILHNLIPRVGNWQDSYDSWAKMATGLIIFVVALVRLYALAGS